MAGSILSRQHARNDPARRQALGRAFSDGPGAGVHYFKLDRLSRSMLDFAEWAEVGHRAREWVAVGPTELRCLRTTAYCLGELHERRWPALHVGARRLRRVRDSAACCARLSVDSARA
jgi:hypothetical protein